MLKLIAMVHSAQSPKEIANVISTDVGMTAKILMLANSAYYSPIKEITSVEQACAMIGLKNLKNFLLVLTMSDYMSVENVELWKKSFIRALIAQKIAERINPQYEPKAYLIGLFSLIGDYRRLYWKKRASKEHTGLFHSFGGKASRVAQYGRPYPI